MKNCATIPTTMTNQASRMIDLKAAISRLRGIVKYFDENYSSHGTVNIFYDINDYMEEIKDNKDLLSNEMCTDDMDFLTNKLVKTIKYNAQRYCEDLLEKGITPFPHVLKLATSQAQTLTDLKKIY